MVLAATVVPDTVPSETVSVPPTSPARLFWAESTDTDLLPHMAPTLLPTTMTTTRATTAGRDSTRATEMPVHLARLTLMRLRMATSTPANTLLSLDTKMPVLRALATEMAVPMTGRRAQANGLLVLADGMMLPVLATQAMPSVVVDTLLLMLVLMPTATRMLTQPVMAMLLQQVTEVVDPPPTLALADMAAGKLLSTLTLMPVLTLVATNNTELTALHGRMPAVMATLALIPLDTALADGALLLTVQLMPMLAKTVSRTVTSTVARPRMNTVMLTVPRMPVQAVTVDTKLMAVVPALLATLPTSVAKALPSASELPVETEVHMLAAVAMATNTLALMAMLMRATVPVEPEVLAAVVPDMLELVQLAITETSQMLELMAEEVTPPVDVAVPMATLVAMALATVALLAMVVDPLAMAVITVLVAMAALAVMAALTVITVLVAMAAMAALVATVVATAATVDTIESCEIKKTTAKRRF